MNEPTPQHLPETLEYKVAKKHYSEDEVLYKSVKQFSKLEQEEWVKEMEWQRAHNGKTRIKSYLEAGHETN